MVKKLPLIDLTKNNTGLCRATGTCGASHQWQVDRGAPWVPVRLRMPCLSYTQYIVDNVDNGPKYCDVARKGGHLFFIQEGAGSNPAFVMHLVSDSPSKHSRCNKCPLHIRHLLQLQDEKMDFGTRLLTVLIKCAIVSITNIKSIHNIF